MEDFLPGETGNELYERGQPFVGWTQEIAAFIKHELGAKQLVLDGRQQVASLRGWLGGFE